MTRMAAALCTLAATALCATGCGDAAPTGDGLPNAPITGLSGEIHLHQFPLGGHAWAAFVDAPVPVSEVTTDELVELDTEPTATEGACTLFLAPTCARACDAGSYCYSPDTCKTLRAVTYVDGGELRITGSRIVPTIRLWFVGADTGYNADPAPGSAPLFSGGEVLHVTGGTGPTRVDGILPAPLPVVVTAPDLTRPLVFPANAPLAVRWKGEAAASMVLSLSVSRSDGAAAVIRCVTADVGTLDVPAAFMARLPPPPRTIRFELERDEERILRTATAGVGMLTHAAFSAWENGNE